ncbi:MAG: hypothetical protein RQ801_13495 [Spirochaetaceae bacterium]|nr:hypothetical protein [Spirochaetaceae bacterium]MDT8299313.1 hypothetical protein [Spirochaetaceae bacterium]
MPISASAGHFQKNDALVEVREAPGGGSAVIIESPLRDLFGAQQDHAVGEVLKELGQTGLIVRVQDNQALDFVLRARVRAAVERFREKRGSR